MDFDDPGRHPGHARRARRLHRAARSPRSRRRTTTSASSTTAASGPAPTSRTTASPQGVGGAAPRDAPAGRRGRLAAPRAPEEFGGRSASNLEMAIIREHLATKGLGLHNDLQNESSIVGNFPTVLMMRDFGTEEQKAEWMPGFLDGTRRLAFGLTEPGHGSDATFLETTAVRRRRRVGAQRHEALQLRAEPRHPRHHLRPHLRRPRLAGRHQRVPRAHRRARLQRRLLLVDLQHAHRPRRGHA